MALSFKIHDHINNTLTYFKGSGSTRLFAFTLKSTKLSLERNKNEGKPFQNLNTKFNYEEKEYRSRTYDQYTTIVRVVQLWAWL